MSDSQDQPNRHKTVRSFVRREGRVTRGQQRALETLWPRYGLAYQPTPYDFDTVFGRRAARVLEIGFGNGEALTAMAAAAPGDDFVGVEVHRPGVGHALLAIDRAGLTNVRLIRHDAVEVLRDAIAPGALSRVHLFFPDPWPKKRHHKRRIVQPPFLDLLARALAPGGVLHMATDWENYAEHMLQTVNAHPDFVNQAGGSDLQSGAVPRPESRPLTKFEQRGHRHGHGVWDFLYERSSR